MDTAAESSHEKAPKASSIKPSILALAGPASASHLLMALVGIINIKMVGSLGTEAIAAVSTGGRIFFIFQAFLMAINAGTTALVARNWGAQNYERAADILKVSIALNLFIAALSSIIMFLFAEEMVSFFGLDETTNLLATEYLTIFGLFTAGFALHLSFGASLRAAGDAITPLWLGAAANVITVFVSYVLIFGKFNIEAMGIRGSAIGGGAGFLSAGLIFLALWHFRKLKVSPSASGFLNKDIAKHLVSIGYPAGLEQLAIQIGFLSFLWVVAFYGTEAFAAYGIGVSILAFSFVIGIGFSIAASTLVGQHLGAGDPAAAKAAGWRAVRISVLVMTIASIIITYFAHPIASYLVEDELVIENTVIFIYTLGAVQPLMAIDFALAGALRGAGDTRFPLLTTISGILVVRLSLALTFLYLDYSIEWIYGALVFDYLIKAILLIHRFQSGKWQYIIKD